MLLLSSLHRRLSHSLLSGFIFLATLFIFVSSPPHVEAAQICDSYSGTSGSVLYGDQIIISGTGCGSGIEFDVVISIEGYPSCDLNVIVTDGQFQIGMDSTCFPEPATFPASRNITVTYFGVQDTIPLTVYDPAGPPTPTPTPNVNSCTNFSVTPSTIVPGDDFTFSASGCPNNAFINNIVVEGPTNMTYPGPGNIGGTSFSTTVSSAGLSPGTYVENLDVNGVVWYPGVFFTIAPVNPTNTPTPTPITIGGQIENFTLGVQCDDPDSVYIGIFDECLDFTNTISLTLTWSLILGTIIGLVRMIIASINFIFSSGQPGKLENARIALTDSLTGLVLLAAAWVLFTYLNETLPSDWQIDLL